MKGKEYLQNRYPIMREHWNESDIDDNWIAQMMDEFALLKVIDENKSILAMAEVHMDERACLVLRDRIFKLEEGICQV